MANLSPKKSKQGDDFLQIQELLYLCLAKWKWFVLSLLITLSAAYIYLLHTPNIYVRTASILVKDNDKGKSISSEVGDFANMGLIQSKTNINNELIMLRSPSIMFEVVKRLRLNVSYCEPGRFYDKILYGNNLPITVSFPELPDNKSVGFTLTITESGDLRLSDFIANGELLLNAQAVQGEFSKVIESPIGKVVIKPTSVYASGKEQIIKIKHENLYAMVGAFAGGLSVGLNEEQSSVINISYSDRSTQRAEDIISSVIAVYNENWVKDKNQIAVSTSMFINERLAVIENELGNVDENISSFKSKNLLPDVQAASQMYMQQTSHTNSEIMTLNNQLYMIRYIRNYLTNEINKNQLLPANTGIEGGNVEKQISEYNSMILQRNNLVANSSTENPLVVDMDKVLSEVRRTIMLSIDNQILALNTQINSLKQSVEKMTERMAANPSQAKYLLSIERQQKVKESLYLFLLQKREENELSQAFTAYNTRIINPPHGSMIPIAPKRKNIMLVAFAIGLAIPTIIIFLKETMNTKLRGRKDLEVVSLPFVGEIPLLEKKKSLLSKNEEKKIVVREGKRDVINDAFRILRTNLEFMNDGTKDSNVIIITSFNPGSGKSFLSLNIAVTLAIKNKKVLVIDGDLRHASASAYVNSPSEGLTNYLSGHKDDIKSLIIADEKYPAFHILPVGTIPPNPTELLSNERMKNVIDTVRKEYDYVLIDCPPLELVADTQILEKLADRTIFVARAGLLDRSMLHELEDVYIQKKYKNMAIILNGTKGRKGKYGYKYGYYGYQYGYHYGSKKEN